MPLMRGHACIKSVQIDAVPFELWPERKNDAFSRESERIGRAQN